MRSSPRLSILTMLLSALTAAAQDPTSTASAWPPYSPTSFPILHMSNDSEFYFFLEGIISYSNGGGANTGEVLRAATEFVPHDFESTFEPLYYLASRIDSFADRIDTSIDPVGAREAYFRASTYYQGSSFHLIGNQTDPRLLTSWYQGLHAFDKGIALLDPPGHRFSLPTYTSDLKRSYNAIGVFYKAEYGNRKLPTVLVGSGYDGSQEGSYFSVCQEVLKRGLNCATYEGPGQPTVRRKQNIGFVSDWWTAASPVVDYFSTRDDVDMDRIALVGISFGGTLAPLAASRDDRYSAIIAIDGLPSLQQVFNTSFGPELLELYDSGNVTLYNEVVDSIRHNASMDTSFRWILDQTQWSFDTTSAFEGYTRLGELTWGPSEAANISMPVFVGKGQNDLLTASQPELAYKYLTEDRKNGQELTYYYQFNTSLGAGEHCQIGAESYLWQVALGWLSGVWGNYSYAPSHASPYGPGHHGW